jgi:hypothetical protein
MARLQILELPEGANDDRPPFLLVVDQADEATADDIVRWPSNIAERTGARHVLVFEGTVDIPANDTSAYIQQAAEETGATIGDAIRDVIAQHLADERTDIARDMDRLAKWKNELLDALGMDHTRDWDDIRNAAAGIRKKSDVQGAAIERVRQLHQPVDYRGTTICRECSAYAGQSTDNAPVAHDQCGTLRAIDGVPEQS